MPRSQGMAAARAKIAARYDAAQTTDDNRRHWSNADGLSADAANNPEIRRKLRNRARYEVANNSYARGLTSTLANYIIGPGPRLQIVGSDRDANRLVEREFTAWAHRIGLAAKLRILREARIHSGEGIAQFVTNHGPGHAVHLDLRIIEADRIATPDLMLPTPNAVDGIRFDQWGNPTTYHILKQHPGGDILSGTGLKYDRVPAERIIHWFRQDRPEQHRGLPEIMSALPLFAQLRRYTLAVLASAETAADFAAVIQSDTPADDDESQPGAFDTLDLEKRLATVLPAGWKLGQLKAEQPTTVYSDFKHEILNEIARCLDIPFNIAAANSAGYNYASGRLDHQSFFRTIEVDRNFAEATVLSPILSAWLREAAVLQGESGEIARAVRQLGADVTFEWLWVGLEHIDPAKQSSADERDRKNYHTTKARIYAKKGLDWEQEARQAAREKALDEELGLLPVSPTGSQEGDSEQADEDETDTRRGSRARAMAIRTTGGRNGRGRL